MNYVGMKVAHKAFGEGTIVKQDDSHAYVQFTTPPKLISFVIPDAFNTFLKLLDAEAAKTAEKEKIEKELEKLKEEEEEKQQHLLQQMQYHGSGSKKYSASKQYASVDDFFDTQNSALVSEIMYLKGHGGKHIRILNGVLVDKKKGLFIYCFESESELNYPDGTQITLWSGSSGIAAVLLGIDELTLYIAVEENLGQNIPSIEFSAEPWRLLDFLTKRLTKLREKPTGIVRSLILDGSKRIKYGQPIKIGQEKAAEMAQTQPITMIWGPPGTGKTYTLAKIALAHIAAKRRVLMLSYSNVSVDGASLRVFEMDSNPKPGRIVRYGYPRNKQLLAHPYLSSYSLTISRHPDLLQERNKLQEEKKKYIKTDKKVLEINERLKAIRAQLTHEEEQTVKEASFVATTVSKAIADKVLYEDKYDVVMFDEASMAFIPQIIFSASLATKHFVCIGDFAQLPPIVQGNKDSVLNDDIFQHCSITDAVAHNCGHEWLCMLNEQRRMHPDIATFINGRMYHGLLKSHPDMASKRKGIAMSRPFAEKTLALADLSGMMSVCTKTLDESRINVLSALVSISLATKAAEDHDVGIIAPYHAQSRLLYALAHDVNKAHPELHKITCATVHQFQGSEQDEIIYDAVDCYRMKYPGILLTSLQNDYANRLFNVAMSRARGRFIAVCNADYMISKNLSAKTMFRNLIDTAKYKAIARSCGEELKKECAGEICKWFDAGKGNTEFLNDLAKAKKEIRIDMPAAPAFTSGGLSALLLAINSAKMRGVKVYIRVTDKALLPVELRKHAIAYHYLTNPITLIDRSITWYGQPATTDQFESEGTFIPTTYRPVIRFAGSKFASALYGFLSMDKIIDEGTSTGNGYQTEYTSFASYVAGKMKCPDCGKPLRLKKGKSAFIGCSGYPGCTHTEKIRSDIVEAYFYHDSKDGKRCPKCNMSIIAEDGKFGLYIHCGGLEKHKFKIEEL